MYSPSESSSLQRLPALAKSGKDARKTNSCKVAQLRAADAAALVAVGGCVPWLPLRAGSHRRISLLCREAKTWFQNCSMAYTPAITRSKICGLKFSNDEKPKGERRRGSWKGPRGIWSRSVTKHPGLGSRKLSALRSFSTQEPPMQGIPLASRRDFLRVDLLTMAHQPQVGSQDHEIIREVGTDPAGTSNYGHDATGRSFTKTIRKTKLFLSFIYAYK